MTKKMISLMLIFAMLVPVSSAVAADNSAVQPTIEEILNGYHEKAFEARAAEENGGASTYSRRSGSEKTLEEETVDELTAAGYEAYNVTAENYDALEESLQTDFADMGLDPEGSYIIVISGEDPSGTNSTNPNARLDNVPEQDFIGDGGGGSNPYFEYTYDGITYNMRYALVTTASSNELTRSHNYTVQEQYWLDNFARNLFNTTLVAVADAAYEKIPFGTLASLIFDKPEDYVLVEL